MRIADYAEAIRTSILTTPHVFSCQLRLSTADLVMLEQRAAEEGLPDQGPIAGILHKDVSCSRPQTHEPVPLFGHTDRAVPRPGSCFDRPAGALRYTHGKPGEGRTDEDATLLKTALARRNRRQRVKEQNTKG